MRQQQRAVRRIAGPEEEGGNGRDTSSCLRAILEGRRQSSILMQGLPAVMQHFLPFGLVLLGVAAAQRTCGDGSGLPCIWGGCFFSRNNSGFLLRSGACERFSHKRNSMCRAHGTLN